MIYRTDQLPQPIFANGNEYTCDYEFIQIGVNTVKGSNNQVAWYPLKGRQLLAYDGGRKPEIVMEEPEDYDPMEF